MEERKVKTIEYKGFKGVVYFNHKSKLYTASYEDETNLIYAESKTLEDVERKYKDLIEHHIEFQ